MEKDALHVIGEKRLSFTAWDFRFHAAHRIAGSCAEWSDDLSRKIIAFEEGAD